MWCTHRPKPSRPIDSMESTMGAYPNTTRREKVSTMADTNPRAGMKMM